MTIGNGKRVGYLIKIQEISRQLIVIKTIQILF